MPPGDLLLLPLLWVPGFADILGQGFFSFFLIAGEHKRSKPVNILPQHPCSILPAVRHDQRLLYHHSLEELTR